ncbi:D(2) dopamine receptor [Elysia marginata]|uniref:D(2) dopamine receptor n=1 Tax=Elysia marginata TaxID=1093978 RepID=A0AAV4ER33_9GAST|nr:D(2) dopamine receptor [Elysia marginata]
MSTQEDLISRTGTWTTSVTNIDNNSSTSITESGFTANLSTKRKGCSADDFNSVGALNYFVILFGIFLVFENILLITVIGRTRSLHTNTNILVASLAVTDVLMGIQCTLNGMIGLYVGFRSWLIKENLNIQVHDTIMLGVNCSLIVTSLLHVTLLTIDRYLYVSWPFRYTRYVTRNRVLATAAGVWTLGLTYMFLPVALFQAAQYRETCIFTNIPVGYGYEPIAVVYVTCLTVVIYCTTRMVQIARDHRVGSSKNTGNCRVLRWQPSSKKKGSNFTEAATNLQKNHELTSDVNPNKSYRNSRDCSGDAWRKSLTYGDEGNFSEIPRTTIFYSSTETLNKHVSPKDAPTLASLEEDQEFALQSSSDHNTEASVASKINNANHARMATSEDPNQRGVKNTPEPTDKTDARHAFQASDYSTKPEDKDHLFKKANLKIIKFVLIVFGSFVVCTLPSILVLSAIQILKLSIFTDSYEVIDLMHFFITFNSGMNFLTISYMNKEFRKALVKIIPICNLRCCAKDNFLL